MRSMMKLPCVVVVMSASRVQKFRVGRAVARAAFALACIVVAVEVGALFGQHELVPEPLGLNSMVASETEMRCLSRCISYE